MLKKSSRLSNLAVFKFRIFAMPNLFRHRKNIMKDADIRQHDVICYVSN
jgi:hypothetical protein